MKIVFRMSIYETTFFIKKVKFKISMNAKSMKYNTVRMTKQKDCCHYQFFYSCF